MNKIGKLLLEKIRKKKLFSTLNFIILYGSFSNGKQTPLSDIDICISLSTYKKKRSKVRLELLSELPDNYDLQIFEDLPLYVQIEVLKGEPLYIKDRKKLILKATNLINEFEDFNRIYTYYLSRNKTEVAL